MKKLLLITLTVFTFVSCENENENDCVCKRAKMTLFSPTAGYFYINNLPIDCNTGEPNYSELPENYIFVKCED